MLHALHLQMCDVFLSERRRYVFEQGFVFEWEEMKAQPSCRYGGHVWKWTANECDSRQPRNDA